MLLIKKNAQIICTLILVLILNMISVCMVYAEDTSDVVEAQREVDTDCDGLVDELELQLGTDPDKFDTDGDLLSDGYELMVGFTNPLNIDTDGNGN